MIMESRDGCADMLGIECIEVGEHSAKFRMTVSGNMLNMHKTCHGGMIFTLADTAFAFACNSDERTAVAQSANIDYLEPAYEGDELVATASSRVQKKRTGIYDIEVRNQSDTLVAIFTGKAFTLRNKEQ
jgi:acyl-CoA thioesterase